MSDAAPLGLLAELGEVHRRYAYLPHAEGEAAARARLIELGWTPPERAAEAETAVAQAVDFAEYVCGAAKGGMVERAERYLSTPYADRVRRFLAAARRTAVDGAVGPDHELCVLAAVLWP